MTWLNYNLFIYIWLRSTEFNFNSMFEIKSESLLVVGFHSFSVYTSIKYLSVIEYLYDNYTDIWASIYNTHIHR